MSSSAIASHHHEDAFGQGLQGYHHLKNWPSTIEACVVSQKGGAIRPGDVLLVGPRKGPHKPYQITTVHSGTCSGVLLGTVAHVNRASGESFSPPRDGGGSLCSIHISAKVHALMSPTARPFI